MPWATIMTTITSRIMETIGKNLDLNYMAMEHLDAEKALTDVLMDAADKKKYVLAYVKPICRNNDGTYEYDFFFSKTPDIVWGPDWDVDTPSVNGDSTPDSTTYDHVRRVKTNLPLKTAEETSCMALQYAIYGILALAWIDIESLDVYPEHGRLTLHFGENELDIEQKLAMYKWKFSD